MPALQLCLLRTRAALEGVASSAFDKFLGCADQFCLRRLKARLVCRAALDHDLGLSTHYVSKFDVAIDRLLHTNVVQAITVKLVSSGDANAASARSLCWDCYIFVLGRLLGPLHVLATVLHHLALRVLDDKHILLHMTLESSVANAHLDFLVAWVEDSKCYQEVVVTLREVHDRVDRVELDRQVCVVEHLVGAAHASLGARELLIKKSERFVFG